MAAANKHWRREMLAYFCFTLPGALFPIGCLYVARVDQGYPFRIVDVAAESTILAIAIGLYMDAVSTLFKSGPKWFEIKFMLAGFAAIAMTSASFFYGLRYMRGTTNSVVYVHESIVVFIVSIVIATFCRFLPEDN